MTTTFLDIRTKKAIKQDLIDAGEKLTLKQINTERVKGKKTHKAILIAGSNQREIFVDDKDLLDLERHMEEPVLWHDGKIIGFQGIETPAPKSAAAGRGTTHHPRNR